MIATNDRELKILREGGRRLARIRDQVAGEVRPGVTTGQLNQLGEKLIREGGDTPAFLNYTPQGAERPYPATVCISINEEVVHGVPNENSRELKEGDIVGLDIGLIHEGLITDTAVTVPVGTIDEAAQKLIQVTQESLMVGIKASRIGNRIGDIGRAIEGFVNGRYGIVRELGGHGVGRKVHEDPHIPNFGEAGAGPEIVKGMVLALEPMLNEGTENIELSPDGYTFKTADGKRSAHFEHTILITEGEPEVLTK